MNKISRDVPEGFAPDFFYKDILSMEEASQFTGLSKSALYKLTMNRAIPFSKPGGKMIFFRKSDLVAYMMGNTQKSKSEILEETEQFLLIQKNKKS
ncbi:MAG: helix-turn-helix domain-containing protein [Chitinophagales bacterium]